MALCLLRYTLNRLLPSLTWYANRFLHELRSLFYCCSIKVSYIWASLCKTFCCHCFHMISLSFFSMCDHSHWQCIFFLDSVCQLECHTLLQIFCIQVCFLHIVILSTQVSLTITMCSKLQHSIVEVLNIETSEPECIFHFNIFWSLMFFAKIVNHSIWHKENKNVIFSTKVVILRTYFQRGYCSFT